MLLTIAIINHSAHGWRTCSSPRTRQYDWRLQLLEAVFSCRDIEHKTRSRWEFPAQLGMSLRPVSRVNYSGGARSINLTASISNVNMHPAHTHSLTDVIALQVADYIYARHHIMKRLPSDTSSRLSAPIIIVMEKYRRRSIFSSLIYPAGHLPPLNEELPPLRERPTPNIPPPSWCLTHR
jgi:hypothetical protein